MKHTVENAVQAGLRPSEGLGPRRSLESPETRLNASSFGFSMVLALIFAIALAPVASAHEGHDHKILGTVSAIRGQSLDVKTTDGRTSTISLTDKTKILQGTMVMKAADIKTGDRVVVTATGGGKAPFVAKEVRLGAAAQAPKAPAKKRGDQ